MQLHLDREDLQLLADLLENRLAELRSQARDRPADAALQRELSDLEAVLDGLAKRRLQFGCDELESVSELLSEICRRLPAQAVDAQPEPRRRRLERLRDKVAEVCAMI